MIKRLVAVLLSMCLFASAAYAEGGGNVLDSIGDWFGQAWDDSSKWTEQAWNDSSEWAGQAWKDASGWTEQAWGDASKGMEQAWNDASPELEKIWGDVSDWATGVYNAATGSVSAWWIDTFKKVTETKDQAWAWIQSASEDVRAKIADAYTEIQNGSSDIGKLIKEVYTDLLKKLDLIDDDILKVLETLWVYAGQNGITIETLAKVLIPYLVQLIADYVLQQNGQISAFSVVLYLTGIMVEKRIGSEEEAQRMIDTLKETLNIQ